MKLAGRIALVTGAGRRVGRALALALGGRGMRVVVHYHQSAGGARETVDAVERSGGEARAVHADLASDKGPRQVVERAAAAFGGLDAVVNSAAIMRRTPIGDVTVAEWDEMFAINLRAPFFTSQAAAPLLANRSAADEDRASAPGAIVNIADLAAFETWPGYIPHGITKSGLVQMTRALARVLAPRVRVNAVAPGPVLLPENWDAADAEHLVSTTPLARLGAPGDVAAAVIFLLESDYITGETVIVDGGRHVRR
ncbi:MAG: SDR family oxidoreductase [Gemmatimonadaceae bacterium]